MLELRLLLPTLTLRKIVNLAALWLSYGLARWTGKPIHWGMPAAMGVEPTTACNLRCPECVSGLRAFERPIGRLKTDLYQKLIDEVHPHLLYLIFYFQGEPYLNPNFLEFVAYASRKKVFTMTSTNGHFLDEETARKTVESGLGRLVVSMDGATQETYEKYRIGGSLDEVKAGIERLVAWKKKLKSQTPFIDLQFIVFAHNEHEIEEIKRVGKALGVDRVSIKTAQFYDFEKKLAQLPQNDQYSRYVKTPEGGVKIKSRLPNHCWKLWSGAEVTWDGRVVPCCFDKNANHEMGRFPLQTFRNIWKHGEAYARFRQQISKGRKEIEMCRNCSEGLEVKLNDFV